MTERIVGDYVMTRVNEVVDGFPCQTIVARLDPPNATHFQVTENILKDGSYLGRVADSIYVLGQHVGEVVATNYKHNIVLCEVIPVG